LYFCAGENTRKARNLALDPRCVVTVEQEPLDLVLEGRAVKVRDAPTLRRVADAYAKVLRHQGVFPLGIDHPDQLADVVALPPGSDPAPYAAVGATWWLVELPWVPVSVDQVRGVIRDGTATPRASARVVPG
jgi:hypothetical protein